MKFFRSIIVALVILAVFTPIMTKEAPTLQHTEFGTFVSGHAVNWERVKDWVYPWRWFRSSPTANPPAAQSNTSSQPAAESKPAPAKTAAAEPAKAKL